MPRRLRSVDPAASGVAVFGLMILAGFGGILLSWRVVSTYTNVAYQLPAIVSGGVGGLGLIVLGAALLHVHIGRRLAAQAALHDGDLADDLAAAVEILKAQP